METLPAGVEVANADDVVDMHDDPASVMKTRKNSSMLVGLQMLKEMCIRDSDVPDRSFDRGPAGDCSARLRG